MISDFQRDMVETRASRRVREARKSKEVKSLPVVSRPSIAPNGIADFILINSTKPMDAETYGFYERTYSRRSKLSSSGKAGKVRIIHHSHLNLV